MWGPSWRTTVYVQQLGRVGQIRDFASIFCDVLDKPVGPVHERAHFRCHLGRARFVCQRCGAFGWVTEGDPKTDPEYQGFEMDHGAVEAEQRAAGEPPPPPPVWLPPTDPRLETARRRLTPVYAEIDHRNFLLIAWIETAWHTLRDGLPIYGTITRWRYWEGYTGARKALGL